MTTFDPHGSWEDQQRILYLVSSKRMARRLLEVLVHDLFWHHHKIRLARSRKQAGYADLTDAQAVRLAYERAGRGSEKRLFEYYDCADDETRDRVMERLYEWGSDYNTAVRHKKRTGEWMFDWDDVPVELCEATEEARVATVTAHRADEDTLREHAKAILARRAARRRAFD